MKVRRFRVDLQKALLAWGARTPVTRLQVVNEAWPDPDLQHHELGSRLPLRYCSVCTDPPTKKGKVLGEISGNSQSTEAQKWRKARFGCVKCVATCIDSGCFTKHCNTTNISYNLWIASQPEGT